MKKNYKEIREKEQLQKSRSRQTSKQMAKEICHDTISSVATQGTEYRRTTMLRQKIACCDRSGEECNQSIETKKVNVVTRFVNWMSTLRKTCRDIKAPVTTLETRRKHKFCHDEVSYVALRN